MLRKQSCLGYMYSEGLGVRQDDEQAVFCIAKLLEKQISEVELELEELGI